MPFIRSTAPVAPPPPPPPPTEPSWTQGSLNINVPVGSTASVDLSPFLTNYNPSLHTLSVTAGSLPTGVSADSVNSELDVSGAQTLGDNRTVTLSIVDNAVADWIARSTAAGVVFADAWESLPPVTSSGTNPVTNGTWRFANDSRITLDTTIKPAGAAASIRMAFLNNQTTLGQTDVTMRSFFGIAKQFTIGDEMWFSFRMRAPREYLWQQLPHSAETAGHKFGIMSHWQYSHTNNECVPEDSDNENILGSYIDGVNYDKGDVGFNSGPGGNGSDFRRQEEINRGANPLSGNNPDTGGAWSAWQQVRAQYGPTHGARSNPGAPEYRRGYGDPFSGQVRFIPDEWVTITICNTLTAWSGIRHRMWVARDGQAYTKVRDTTQAVNSDPGLYNTFWPMNYVSHLIDGGRKITARTNNITGVTLSTCGLSTPVGNGTLSWDATNQRLTWAGFGESAGTAVGFSAANNILVRNVGSGSETNSFLVVEKSGTLPVSNQTDTVTIGDGRPDTYVNYAQFIVSTQSINAPGGYAPT